MHIGKERRTDARCVYGNPNLTRKSTVRSHASGSACGAIETGFSVPEDRVSPEVYHGQRHEPQRYMGKRMAWTRDNQCAQLVPLRRAR